MKRQTLMLLVYVGISSVVFVVSISLWMAPYFSLALISILFAIILFILTERWLTHDASEFENRFWSFIAFLLSSAILFISDSPLRLGLQSPVIGITVIILCTYIVHNYDRHLRRLVLLRIPDLRRTHSMNGQENLKTIAQSKVQKLHSLIDEIDPKWLSSAFYNTLYIMKVESDIINIFSDASQYELNYILKESALGLIFYKVKDHRFWNGFHRTKLLHLLTVERILETNVYSRAMLIHGLQQMKLSAHSQCEEWAKNIILKTTRDELSELKTIMDCKGDINSMHKLIYQDIRNPRIKQEILEHITREARVQIAHMSLGTRVAKRRQQFAWRKILSDVDDTLSCSGGSFPAGIDDSYPKKAIYPGVLAFYRELDLGTGRDESWDHQNRLGNLVFLSARPHVYKDLSEKHSYAKFRKLLECNRLHTSPSLLAGSLDTGGQFLVEGSLEPLARKKFENFVEYLALYPEFTCVFIGDNGQGDVRASEMLLEHSTYNRNVERVYMHEVQPLHKTHALKAETKSRRSSKIYYFRTYVDAGVDALKHGLIRQTGLRRIMEEAVRDYQEIPEIAWLTMGMWEGIRAREFRRLELRQAIMRANKELVRFGLPPVSFPNPPCILRIGTAVHTLFGKGIILRYRRSDGIYVILLNCGWDPEELGEVRKNVIGYMTAPHLTPMVSSLEKLSSIRPTSTSANLISIVNTPNTKTKVTQQQLEKTALVPVSAALGATVWTPYGFGKIIRQRIRDRVIIIEVTLSWRATAFLDPSRVIVLRLASISSPKITGMKSSSSSGKASPPPLPSTPSKSHYSVGSQGARKALFDDGNRDPGSGSGSFLSPREGRRERGKSECEGTQKGSIWQWYFSGPGTGIQSIVTPIGNHRPFPQSLTKTASSQEAKPFLPQAIPLPLDPWNHKGEHRQEHGPNSLSILSEMSCVSSRYGTVGGQLDPSSACERPSIDGDTASQQDRLGK